jgi:hypothetical protein
MVKAAKQFKDLLPHINQGVKRRGFLQVVHISMKIAASFFICVKMKQRKFNFRGEVNF